jgi:hypothetical protein
MSLTFFYRVHTSVHVLLAKQKYTQKKRPGENEMEYPNPTIRKFVFKRIIFKD